MFTQLNLSSIRYESAEESQLYLGILDQMKITSHGPAKQLSMLPVSTIRMMAYNIFVSDETLHGTKR